MSIYATLWTLKFPAGGDFVYGGDWIGVTAQGVPGHIGSPAPGGGCEGEDPFPFLPPPIPDPERLRAVVFVKEGTRKGTARSAQEYVRPLLVLAGGEYERIGFDDLHRRLCDALRGDRPPVIAEIFGPGGRHRVVRADRPDDAGAEDVTPSSRPPSR